MKHLHSAQQTIYVTVKLTLNGSANPRETIENLDYNFQHDDIVDSEILGFCDE
jgi:hypothetical protein